MSPLRARLALCAIAALSIGCGGGDDAGEAELPPGFWYAAEPGGDGAPPRPLDGLGYADGFERAGGANGAFVLDASRVARR